MLGSAATGIFHPNFYYMPRTGLETAMVATVEVYRPNGTEGEHWEPGGFVGSSNNALIWRSKARVQPNKDWRARVRAMQGEFDATHAVRFQLPIGGNELAGKPKDVAFYKDDLVRVIGSPVVGSEGLLGNRFVVRNAINSANLWLHNLLCDVGTKDQ